MGKGGGREDRVVTASGLSANIQELDGEDPRQFGKCIGKEQLRESLSFCLFVFIFFFSGVFISIITNTLGCIVGVMWHKSYTKSVYESCEVLIVF